MHVTKPVEVTKVSKSADRPDLDWLLSPKVPKESATLADRVLGRLIQAEAHEPNIHLKSDYRQAFICLTLAGRGNTEPFTVASYSVHCCHPDNVWPRRVAEREAKLAGEYDSWFDAAGNLRPDIPKKPSLNVERHSTNREACTTEKELTEISSPRRLRVKGTDIDSLMGCRIESSETGILASDGPSEDRPIAKAHDSGETYTTAVTPELQDSAATQTPLTADTEAGTHTPIAPASVPQIHPKERVS